ncbi:hypothetical protein K470DRAFT_70630 [Piedraia hortae CBS 480.64]|uniref:Uncharacterized protein n=1 Tax=Piedraia hortae CBS 480.64 TaxID=1314780 RepID=A0A6A7BZJ0_9PEZI|nr:hypothetical protein K470DRAFT_70630 [Piedraia hortae CBS 480.64]
MARLRRTFDRSAFEGGLMCLSAAIFKSHILAPFRLLGLIACGGFVSVMYLENRQESHDLDFFLSHRQLGTRYELVRLELHRLIAQVAKELGFHLHWAVDVVRVFLQPLPDLDVVFDRSL